MLLRQSFDDYFLAGASWVSTRADCSRRQVGAIVFADYGKLKGSTIYITDWPCDGCMRLIKGVGIRRIVTPNEEGN